MMRTMKMMKTKMMVAMPAMALVFAPALPAQTPDARPEDVASPEAIIAAAYEAISRAPGERFDWDRFRSLYVPGALMIPNTEQSGGEFTVHTVEEFNDWVDAWYAENAPIGGENDQGFVEEGIHSVTNRYGDVVQVMSTYHKRLYDSDDVLGRGINAFTLVFDGERWWIASTAWDEENGAGPIPAEYLP
ncbi:MAG TPA: hypothetical protein VLA33_09440 [Gemmatimonadota bacterium]|nr:hypothetical protein [Gemmatimonadota bacterium]